MAEFEDPGSFTSAILKILSDQSLKESMEKNAYSYSRHMTWPNVAISYLNLFRKYMNISSEYKLPVIRLDHLHNLTDEFGIIQFANHAVPDTTSGYTLDDNARALIVCSMHYNLFGEDVLLEQIKSYLNFIEYVQSEDGRIYNYVDYGKKINVDLWTDDAHGRAMWALGLLMGTFSIPASLKLQAERILGESLKVADTITSPRAVSFSIIGLCLSGKSKTTENIERTQRFADHLVSLYNDSSSEEWHWFESSLSYSNSKISEALFYAYQVTGNQKYLNIAEQTLSFLCSVTFEKGMFSPIGQNGWYIKNGHKAYYDQQPVDAASMVQTLVLAYNITQKDFYLKNAIIAFQWFIGNNSLRQVVYDELTGGCHDGIGEFSINLNKGAESTISYLIARLTVEEEKIRQLNSKNGKHFLTFSDIEQNPSTFSFNLRRALINTPSFYPSAKPSTMGNKLE